jgi:hypothetical protein
LSVYPPPSFADTVADTPRDEGKRFVPSAQAMLTFDQFKALEEAHENMQGLSIR